MKETIYNKNGIHPVDTTYGIYDTEAMCFVSVRSGKTSWSSTGAAKNAFNNSLNYNSWREKYSPRMDDHPRFEVKEIEFNIAQ